MIKYVNEIPEIILNNIYWHIWNIKIKEINEEYKKSFEWKKTYLKCNNLIKSCEEINNYGLSDDEYGNIPNLIFMAYNWRIPGYYRGDGEIYYMNKKLGIQQIVGIISKNY